MIAESATSRDVVRRQAVREGRLRVLTSEQADAHLWAGSPRNLMILVQYSIHLQGVGKLDKEDLVVRKLSPHQVKITFA